ncbi:hypothetical protein PROSTU_01335 [Providencia stuartii ATCC 25827]|uniref:Uncharacterized protein n=1 Tax=Providencia stuartii ATCC 25827 TaxID=471874 RepID=A0AA87CVP6_PROST|nr:hypothetical protein PROSTU_01335 [Providencia stuartii ATCC 25827]
MSSFIIKINEIFIDKKRYYNYFVAYDSKILVLSEKLPEFIF